MALVCILRDYNFTRQGIIEYNFLCLHDSIHKIFAVRFPRKVGKFTIGSAQDDEFEDDANGNYVNGNSGHGNGQSYDKIHHQSNSQLANFLLSNKIPTKVDN